MVKENSRNFLFIFIFAQALFFYWSERLTWVCLTLFVHAFKGYVNYRVTIMTQLTMVLLWYDVVDLNYC